MNPGAAQTNKKTPSATSPLPKPCAILAFQLWGRELAPLSQPQSGF